MAHDIKHLAETLTAVEFEHLLRLYVGNVCDDLANTTEATVVTASFTFLHRTSAGHHWVLSSDKEVVRGEILERCAIEAFRRHTAATDNRLPE